jgi:NitT/TauT family transport system permease protein
VPLMALHNQRLGDGLRARSSFGVDLLVLAAVASLAAALFAYAGQVAAVYHERTVIDLSFWSLPKYTFFSLCRGVAAYVLSLLFTLVYGTLAAHNRQAERVMLPVLDVLQAIPVLGFLPGLVLAMVALFPTREVGLEVACVVMIFTGQAWNMVFSFHGSLRGIPQPLRDVAAVQRLGGWKTFRLLEVPAATIGLVWNSMMSMAGGWFFLTVNEAFTLGNKDFRLPGIGSYMSEAIGQGNAPAMLMAVLAMVVMIVVVDQVFWRPVVVWSRKYKLEDSAGEDEPRSWVLSLLRRSRLLGLLRRRRSERGTAVVVAPTPSAGDANAARPAMPVRFALGSHLGAIVSVAFRWIALALLAAGVAWGGWTLARLLVGLPLRDPGRGDDWLHVVLALLASFLRTTAAVAIGAAWALPAGILIGLSAKWSRRLQPVIQVVASFPAPMLFPLVTLLMVALRVPFTAGCVALMILGAQWYILFNVIAGATAIPAELKEVARVYRMGRWQTWTKLYVPGVFPYLVTGLVTAAGGAWNASIVSEFIQLPGRPTFVAFGLGSMINRATAAGNFNLLCAAVVTMAAFVVTVNRLVWKRLYRLAEGRYSLGT